MILREKDTTLKSLLLQEALKARDLYAGKLDNWWGKKSEAAYQAFLAEFGTDAAVHHVIASSFADPADIAAFKKCKKTGKTDKQCFAVGDNGIGCWGDDTTGKVAMCALPPEDMIERWGSVARARLKPVRVTIGKKTIVALLGDRMPARANIKNGAGIDLNPAACKALGVKIPLKTPATWSWA
jgi:hypothetical protein